MMHANEHEGRTEFRFGDYYIDRNFRPTSIAEFKALIINPRSRIAEYPKIEINYQDPDKDRILASMRYNHKPALALVYAEYAINHLTHSFEPRGCLFVCQRCGCAKSDVHHDVGAQKVSF